MKPLCVTSCARERINVIATETGGSRGRTIRVYVGSHRVTVREAGGTEKALVAGRRVGARHERRRTGSERGRDRRARRRRA